MTLTSDVWWLGIDVGRNGAFAVWNPAKDKLHLRNMPPTPQGVYDLCKGIADLDIALCMVEKPIYMQASGVKNVSVMAFNYGVLYLSLTLNPDTIQGSRAKTLERRAGSFVGQAAVGQYGGKFVPVAQRILQANEG